MAIMYKSSCYNLFLALVFALYSSTWSLRLDECSSTALGMESQAISDGQITASSSFDRQSVGPQNARIRTEMVSGAWCPKPQIDPKSYEFLQINLDKTFILTAVETQGRFGNGTGREFASEYMIDYLRPGITKWIRYRNRTGQTVMTGNADTVNAVMRSLDPPIVASRIRLVPHSKQKRTICMRAEVYGCLQKDGLLYYSATPEGSRIGHQDFRDSILESTDLFNEIGSVRGLGVLSDGFVSDNSPFAETNRNGSWVGWNKHHSGGTVNLLFEFDQLRNFSEVLLAAYGHRMDSIDVIFSHDGQTFPLSSQISSLDRLAPNSTEKRFDLRLPLHKRMAKKVRLTLKFSAEWIFLTEVHFASVYANDTTDDEAADQQAEKGFNNGIFGVLGMTILMSLVVLIFCGMFCCRKRNDKEGKIYGGSEDCKKDLIITHLGGKTTSNIYPSKQQSYMSPYGLIGGDKDYGNYNGPDSAGLLYSEKTTSTSVSSKSGSSDSKGLAPTWNDFHFPPPPEAPEHVAVHAREQIYAEPCALMAVLPPVPPSPGKYNTATRSPRRMRHEESLHYATGGVFGDSLGIDKIQKFAFASIQLGQDLGEGKMTVVRECNIAGRGRAAYKCCKDTSNLHARKALLDELRTLSVTSHTNIVQLFGTDEHGSIIEEIVMNGDVKNYLGAMKQPVSTETLLRICADTCAGMAHLESLGLIHGHLTPSNILLDNSLRAKISSPRGQAHPAQLRYSAPESIIMNTFSSHSDCWAFAVASWEILNHCQRLPFEGLSNTDIVENAERVLTGSDDAIYLLFDERLPIKDIYHQCYASNPKDRPRFTQIHGYLIRILSE